MSHQMNCAHSLLWSSTPAVEGSISVKEIGRIR